MCRSGISSPGGNERGSTWFPPFHLMTYFKLDVDSLAAYASSCCECIWSTRASAFLLSVRDFRLPPYTAAISFSQNHLVSAVRTFDFFHECLSFSLLSFVLL